MPWRRYNLTECPWIAYQSAFRKLAEMLVPDVGYFVMMKVRPYKLAGKNLLIFTHRDFSVRPIGQNNLLHANLMASKVRIKPIKMTLNGT